MKNGDMPISPISIELISGFAETPPSRKPFGTTKREYFAGLAMQGLVNATDANGTWAHNPDCVASAAVDYADALLEALEKSQ